jgi:hypothetical protein
MPYGWNVCESRVDALATEIVSLELMLLAPVSWCSWILKQQIEHEHALHNEVRYDLEMMC